MAALACLGAAVAFGGGGALGGGIAFGGGGGVGAPEPPGVRDVTCESSCAGLREATEGSQILLSGSNLDYVRRVKLSSRDGGRIGVRPRSRSAGAVSAVVPRGAASGKPVVVDEAGQRAKSPVELKIVSADAVQSADGFAVRELSVAPAKAYFASKRKATAEFVVEGDRPQDVRVDVVRRGDGTVVQSLVAEDQEPFTPGAVRWNGETDSRRIAPNGEYKFEVKPVSGGEAARSRFEQYDHKFPLRGKHTYGDGLGAARAGHSHQGQDVFGRCGARMVAARGGKVQTRAYHSAAGYYVVIDGKKSKIDYVYMHLQGPAKVREGQRVKTGQTIGRNGESGNASGCHLHFEMWKGGWYEGGHFIDPRPHLKRWDRWS